jgi:hypothetical protein
MYVHVYVQSEYLFPYISLKKWKHIKIIITIFDWNQNLIGYDISLFFFMSRSRLSLG